MKKPADKKKKKKSGRKRPHTNPPQKAAAARPETPAETRGEEGTGDKEPKKITPQPAVKKEVGKRPEKKKDTKGPIVRYASMAMHFFREARVELKKVKWPTRKELLASTAMVIFLALISALYLGIVDFGLIKIIRLVVG
ncbi:MAG: preprotein translocase subunit SecE [Thermodesulfobacteriota bacterium]